MKYWKKLTRASKIVFFLWTIDATYMFFSGESNIGLLESIIVWIFGYLIFVGSTQVISERKNAEKHERYDFEKDGKEAEYVDLEKFAIECNYYVVREERRAQCNNKTNKKATDEIKNEQNEINDKIIYESSKKN